MLPKPRKTRKAWDEPGHVHFVAYSCYRRWPLLRGERTCRWVVDAMDQTRCQLDVALLAFVLMPEHVHVVLLPRRSDCEMRRVLASLKRTVSSRAREYLMETRQHEWLDRLTVRYPSRTVFRFWQSGGGYDHNIWRERALKEVVDYVHANPVRRGLVDDPIDWHWSSARFWDGAKDVPIKMDSIEG